MPRFLSNMAIGRKLTAILMLASISALLTASAIVLTYEVTIYRDELPRRLGIVARVIADQVSDPVIRQDGASATRYLAGLKHEPGIVSARVFDANSRLVAQYSHGPRQPPNPPPERPVDRMRFEFVGDRVILLLPVVAGSRAIGTMEVISNTDELDEELSAYLAWFGVLLLACVAASFWLSRFLQRRISDPLVDLARVMRQVTEDKDYSLRVERTSSDEIGTLIDGFNEMLTEISQRDRQLEQYGQGLESAVAARTRELVRAKEGAEDASRAKNAFLATTSHELRTPLNAIIGFSSLMLDGSMGVVPAEQRKPLTIIRRSGEELLDLVRDILDLSSIEAGNLVVHPEQVQLRPVLDELCEALAVQVRERKLEMRPVVCDESIVVLADRARLSQVVRALCTNALKFTDHGCIQLRAAAEGDFVRMEIEDTGIGIPAAQHESIFQAFHRVENRTDKLRPGTGLGLSICKRIVEAMGGQIGVTSEPGHGSRFWFTLVSGVRVLQT